MLAWLALCLFLWGFLAISVVLGSFPSLAGRWPEP
jgi:hypothetical protein